MTVVPSEAALTPWVASGYDAVLFDLDGVVYIDGEPVEGVPDAVATLRSRGVPLAFVTNNASRTPEQVADRLTAIGVPVRPADVVTSAQAAAAYAAERLPIGATVLAVGAPALARALSDRGLVPVASAQALPVAVVQGFSPDLCWQDLAEASVALHAGAEWIACNRDATLPSARGPVPGNGSLVAALAHATGRTPTFVGKPHPAMHRAAVARTAATRPLIVGDRLDTDIVAANAAGCDSMLVLSGITQPAQLLTATPEQRPTYLGLTAGALLDRPQDARAEEGGFSCGSWRAEVACGRVVLTGSHPAGDLAGGTTVLDALLALCLACWRLCTTADSSCGAPFVVADDTQAEAVLQRLGIPAAPAAPFVPDGQPAVDVRAVSSPAEI